MARIKLQEKRELQHGQIIQMAKLRNDYITNLIQGRYFLERCNMIAEQLVEGGTIIENIDGCPKSPGFMQAEYAHQKIQAIKSMRNSFFAKKDLKENFNHTDEEIKAIEVDYYDGKIMREDYDEIYKKRNKTQFVNSPKNK